MNNKKYDTRTLLVLAMSFSLSAFAYVAANDHDVIPVQAIWMDEFEITPRVETLEFDDYVIVAQLDDSADDGDTDGIDWRRNEEFWCATHPEACEVDLLDVDEDEEEGC